MRDVLKLLREVIERSSQPSSIFIKTPMIHKRFALLSKALSKQSTVAAIYMLDYVLPQVAKLSRTLQTEHLDLSVKSSLVGATLYTLYDTLLPSANWVLELLDEREHLEEAAGIKVILADITFQEQAAKPFIAHLKENISSHFTSSSDIMSALSNFDPRKAPKVDSPDLPQYGEQAITTLLAHTTEQRNLPRHCLVSQQTGRLSLPPTLP